MDSKYEMWQYDATKEFFINIKLAEFLPSFVVSALHGLVLLLACIVLHRFHIISEICLGLCTLILQY